MSDKPVAHPAPWRWDYSVLRDANDLAILVLSDEGEAPDLPEDMRAIIAAAPEMEALLREYMSQEGACPSCKKVRPALLHNGALPRGWHAEDCRLGLLLERIDGAKEAR